MKIAKGANLRRRGAKSMKDNRLKLKKLRNNKKPGSYNNRNWSKRDLDKKLKIELKRKTKTYLKLKKLWERELNPLQIWVKIL